jgi:hypothetical protein
MSGTSTSEVTMSTREPLAHAPSTRHRPLLGFLLIVGAALLLGACSSSSGHATPTSTPAATSVAGVATSVAAAPTTAVPNGHVDLTFTGAINAHVVGTSARCDYYVPSTHYGLVYEANGAQNGHPEIGAIQLSAESATAPSAVILNAPGASFLRHENDGTVTLAADRTHASIDATLKTVTSDKSVHVSGTISCG